MPRTAADYPGFPSDLATEFDTTTARITEIHAQIAVLREELRPLIAAREAALDLYAETTDDPAALLALADASTIAHRKILAHLRTLHPYLYSYNQYHLNTWDDEGNQTSQPTVLTGPHVSLTRHRDRPLNVDQSGPLAAALVEFAHAYNPDPIGLLPEWGMGDHTGMIQADILTEHHGSPVLWYTTDGTQAAYYPDTNNGHTGWDDPTTGTLADVLAYAITEARRPVEDDDPTNW